MALCFALMVWPGVFGALALGAVAGPAAAPRGRHVPLSPVPFVPENGDTVPVVSPVLEVESSIPFGCYHFRVKEGATVVTEGYSDIPKWEPGSGGRVLQRGHSYSWSCRVYDSGGWSPWFSPAWGFAVGFGLPAPDPKLPADGARVLTRRPLLTVRPVGPGVRYRFRVHCGKTLMGEGVSDLPLWLYEGTRLERGEVYQWTCRIEESGDTSDWFEPMWSFEVLDMLPKAGAQGKAESQEPEAKCRMAAAPNPFSDRVSISVDVRSGRGVRIEVYSADGRLVRVLLAGASGSRAARRYRFEWDGRDNAGRILSPGTYFCRVPGEGVSTAPTRHEVFRLTKMD